MVSRSSSASHNGSRASGLVRNALISADRTWENVCGLTSASGAPTSVGTCAGGGRSVVIVAARCDRVDATIITGILRARSVSLKNNRRASHQNAAGETLRASTGPGYTLARPKDGALRA